MYSRLSQSFAEREKFGDENINTEPDAERPAYHQYPIKVTRKFREGLIAAFPALENHPRSRAYRVMLEYLMYATLRDEEGQIVFPAETLANLIGEEVGANGFRAMDYLEGFSADIFPLIISDYVAGKLARTVDFDLPDIIGELMATNTLFAPDSEMVWLVSGLPVSPTSRRKAAARYEEGITPFADGMSEDHPACELQTYLNSQSQITLGKYVRTNWHRLVELHSQMEEGESKNSAGFVLVALEDWVKNLYGGSEKTVRISTRGITIHSLPRVMRKAALTGAIEMDIKSSQAAIVAQLWNLPNLRAFLASGRSFWTEMLQYLDLPAQAKDPLNTTLYSTCFGMGKRKLTDRLAANIGREKALAFFKHPLMMETLDGRKKALARVIEQGGITDAFGTFNEHSRERPAHALLASEAQSWELRLMLPVFDTVKEVDGISILSWLHDGVVVAHRDRERLGKLVTRAKQVFDQNAATLSYPTELEVCYL